VSADRIRIDIENGVLVAHRDGEPPALLAGSTIGGESVAACDRPLAHHGVWQSGRAICISRGGASRAWAAWVLPHLIRFVETGTLEGADA
jgi:hypothetical protein